MKFKTFKNFDELRTYVQDTTPKPPPKEKKKKLSEAELHKDFERHHSGIEELVAASCDCHSCKEKRKEKDEVHEYRVLVRGKKK